MHRLPSLCGFHEQASLTKCGKNIVVACWANDTESASPKIIIAIARAALNAHFGVWSSFKELEMRKHVLLLTTTAAILTCGTIAASAQAPGTQPTPGGQMMQQPNQDDYHRYHGGMMGGGMMGGGMMGGGMMGRGMMGRGMMSPMVMRIIFSLMDANGDGKL